MPNENRLLGVSPGDKAGAPKENSDLEAASEEGAVEVVSFGLSTDAAGVEMDAGVLTLL